MTLSQAKVDGQEAVPVSTEAMAALFFENGATADPEKAQSHGHKGKWYEYFDRSENCTKKVKILKSKEADPHGKHQGRYSSSKSGSSKFGGWNDKGLKRFKIWTKLIEDARQEEHAEAVEQEILKATRKLICKMEAEEEEEDGKPKAKKCKESEVDLDLDFGEDSDLEDGDEQDSDEEEDSDGEE